MATQATPHPEPPVSLGALVRRFQETRARTEKLCEGLLPEDLVIQSMPEASPAKWHLAHTTWFFETFLLKPNDPTHFRPFNPAYHFLFNSYYKSQGSHFERARRGLLSRPGVEEILLYRRQIDPCVLSLLDQASPEKLGKMSALVELGIQHEQQHQELLLTDIKHAFWVNPLRPAYRTLSFRPSSESPSTRAKRSTRSPLINTSPRSLKK